MTNFKIISSDEFMNCGWNEKQDFLIFKNDINVEVSISEMAKFCNYLPLLFLENREVNCISPILLQGLSKNQNLLITESGKWVAPHTPLKYESYPFCLMRLSNEDFGLAIDIDSGCISDTAETRFYLSDGRPSDELLVKLEDTKKVDLEMKSTRAICSLVNSLELFKPLALKLNVEGEALEISGLLTINEERFWELDPRDLKQLQQKNGLLLIYTHLISLRHTHKLGELYLQRKRHMAQAEIEKSKQVPAYTDDVLDFSKIRI